MSSPYAVLGNRSLDQWKVTELKEELKKRRLTTRGLKEDLVKRLDEAVRLEWEESAKEDADNGSEQALTESVPSESAKDLSDTGVGLIKEVDGKIENEIDDQRGSSGVGQPVGTNQIQETNTELEVTEDAKYAGVETTVVVSETVEVVSETVESVTALGGQESLKDITDEVRDSNDVVKTPQKEAKIEPADPTNGVRDSNIELENDVSKSTQEEAKLEPADPITELPQVNQTAVVSPSRPSVPDGEVASPTVDLANDNSNHLQPDQDILPLKHQVSKVDSDLGTQVVSDSVSSASVSIIEKNELKVDVITDNVKLGIDDEHEIQPSVGSVAADCGESHPMDVEEPLDKKDVELPLDQKVSEEVGGSNSANVDSLKNIDIADMGPSEKLNLDRSSGEDSMEEDISDSKQMEDKSNATEIRDVEKSEMPVVKEDDDVDVVGVDKPVESKTASAGDKMLPTVTSVKRKFHDKEAVVGDDTVKRPRRWNTEGLKATEPESGSTAAISTPKDSSQPTFKRFSRSDSLVNEEVPKERVVPPSSKPPSNSLRIDRFLRPFTLKAVQELLGKTGNVTSFWMDHIKTHCYVSYSSVEEATETRNAVYNLQWPPNGGRLLVAEFVDPQEVKSRIEAPPPSPATPSGTPTTVQPPPAGQAQPSPRQQLPTPSLPLPPPPPALANPNLVRERLHQSREQPLPVRDRLNLPPPPPLPEKVEPPIVTLDDLFKKTKSTPRIYYLPLSDEQVAAKLKSKGNVDQ